MKIIIVILTLMLLGCAGPMLQKPGATDADAMRDNMECELQGTQYASGMGFNGNLLIIADYKSRCLRSMGYR